MPRNPDFQVKLDYFSSFEHVNMTFLSGKQIQFTNGYVLPFQVSP